MTRLRPASPARRDPPARREPAILNARERRAAARDFEWLLTRGLTPERAALDLRRVAADRDAVRSE